MRGRGIGIRLVHLVQLLRTLRWPVHDTGEVGIMRTFVLCILLGVVAGCGGGGGTVSQEVAPPDDSFAVLDGYGVWMDVAGLGRVWQPSVSYGWRPFDDGQWVWTDRGWMWVSDEPFGWVVYHYGYWAHWGAAGWLCVPGYDWSPARVHWYSGRDYIGWSPLPPPGMSPPQAYDQENIWTIVPAGQFTREHVGRYRAQFQRSVLAPSSEERRAPDVGYIGRSTRQDIRRWRTESEDVRRGGRTLQRVRVRDEAPPGTVVPPGGVAQPPPVVTPPPTARPAPQPPQEKVRQSGQTRTPGATRATPGQRKPQAAPGARPAQPAPGAKPAQPGAPTAPKATPRSPQRTGSRDSVRVRTAPQDTARARVPRR